MSPSWLKVALVTLGVSLVPVYAFADSAPEASPLEQRGVNKGNKDKDKGKHFPMASAQFMQRVDKVIARTKERVEARLDKKGVPADKRAAIMADVDAGAAKVRAAAEQAGKDGTVTQAEAKAVRGLAKEVRQETREKYGKGKPGNGKGKGKGKGKGNGKGQGVAL